VRPMSPRPALALLAIPVLLVLAACGGGTPAGSPTPSDSDPVAEPSPSGTATQLPVDLPADALLVVSATIEARNGATMQVSEVVRKATAWDDATAPERPAAMTAECAGALDESVYEANLWSFAVIDVTATPTNATAWPADEGVWLFPDNEYVAQAESGVLGQDEAVDPDTPNCLRLKNITQPGGGQIVAGFQGDTDAMDAAGHFTRWANHNYGFSSYSDGLVISDCSLHVLPLGTELGWPDPPGYESVIETELCRFGNFVEDVDY
jgi:hypothetical protein